MKRRERGKKPRLQKKKARLDSIQDERDHYTQLRVMAMGAGGLRDQIPDTDGVDIVPPSVDDPVIIRTIAENSVTQSKSPYFGVDASVS